MWALGESRLEEVVVYKFERTVLGVCCVPNFYSLGADKNRISFLFSGCVFTASMTFDGCTIYLSLGPCSKGIPVIEISSCSSITHDITGSSVS